MNTKDKPSIHDDIFQGITYEDLITTLQSNEPIIDESTVINVYNDLRRIMQKDAMYNLMNNMEFILKRQVNNMDTTRIVIAMDNLEYLEAQLLTLVQTKKLRRKDYEVLKQNIDHTIGHLKEATKEVAE